jgi:2-C-methyl-D-erythritol 4-phosphate cytidylyltransferase/2-C-methyl-D-erythritol 2,4-cyclodiphosphate synthase
MERAKDRKVALLVAAGQGSRAGGDVPKQFRMIAGQSVLARAYDALAHHPDIDAVFLVIGEGQADASQAALGDRAALPFITGASTRQGSVRAGLEAIAADGGAGHVLIHDCARPFLPSAAIDRLLAALGFADGAIPVLPVADTLVRGVEGSAGAGVDRHQLFRVQTPQAFRFEAILDAHRAWGDRPPATDDAQLLQARGHDVTLVEGSDMLEKLTFPADFQRAEARFSQPRTIRTGIGYDVHRLVAREELWLGGILIPHDKGLSGHSDADVALHALVDALLGALAEGDIGSHFPPSDPQWRGLASSRFLEHARDRVAARGGEIEHLDLTIICEAPKIGPHRDAMRQRIADILGIALDRISVKATTTERLGFTGRGEGISAQAVATLSLPALSSPHA